MNDKKICFIYCVKDQRMFEESVKFLHALEIPEGYEIDILPVLDAPSMAAGYNYAMKASDAKYKVYLQEDVSIINKNFVEDILKVFCNDPEVGMLGLMGAKELTASAIWWESKELFGKVYDSHTGKMQLLAFREVEEAYQSVEVIDGLLMATQYDIPWKEEIFDDWDFYDLSQSIEFCLNGLKVVIPRQESPWALHDCGIMSTDNYHYYKSLFIHHYEWKKAENKNLPLVSILIPTYNRPQLFELALRSALGQTYPNIEVIIGDDSTNDETERLIKKYVSQFKNIRYVKNEGNVRKFQKHLMLFDLANGEYVNYLTDSDLFHHEKIEKMMKYFLEDTNKEITIVTSHRLIIDDQNNPYPEEGITKRLFEVDSTVDGIEFGDFILSVNGNFIGEPTTALFRKSDLTVPFGTFSGREYGCNIDMATWLNLLAKGKIVYISETLSYFRIHGEQQQQSSNMVLAGTADYMHEILHAPQYGFFNNSSKYLSALKSAKKYADKVISQEGNKEEAKSNDEFRRFYRILIESIDSLEHLEEKTLIDPPLVSVIIPSYHLSHDLELGIRSLLRQSYKHIEIIADGYYDSNDHIQIDTSIPIKYIQTNSIDMVSRVNELIEAASGQYVYIFQEGIELCSENIKHKVTTLLNSKKENINGVLSIRKEVNVNQYGENYTIAGRIILHDVKKDESLFDGLFDKKLFATQGLLEDCFINKSYVLALLKLCSLENIIVTQNNGFSGIDNSNPQKDEIGQVIEQAKMIIFGEAWGIKLENQEFIEVVIECHNKIMNIMYANNFREEFIASLIPYEKHLRELIRRVVSVI
ncbi:glycosyltransferase [Brevibacillus brevis]|uniref:Glycosyltransferase n=1 Tax=Brevibacillus brevis TaxID=1393 RepID=A0A2Z4MPX4_BREBE|nr:glycosyltransferase [Brevibacillus brevis]AWX58582.1 glycosyltransferase [Brevibacillus brevis]